MRLSQPIGQEKYAFIISICSAGIKEIAAEADRAERDGRRSGKKEEEEERREY